MRDQAEANLSALIESTEDLVWSVGLDYRLIIFNSALRRNILGTFGVELVPGMLLDDVLPPDRATLWPPYYQRALAQGPFRVEYALLNGRVLELALNPILVDGEPTGVSVFGKDITERKLAERALLEAQKRYRDIYDGALEGMFQTSPEGKTLGANPALARMLGYDSPEDVTITVTDSAHDLWVEPDERTRYVQLLEQDGIVLGFECQFKRKDGAVLWVSLSCRKVYEPDGSTRHYEGFIEDITVRKRAEMQLRDSEERYRTIFRTSLDPVSLTHLDDGKFIDVNQAFLDLMGFAREEVIGRSTLELNIWANSQDLRSIVEVLRKNSICKHFETRFRKKNGEIFWVLNSAALIEIDGVCCILGVLRDLSEAKAAEDQIRHLAFYDPLTLLPNRRLLLDRLKQAMAVSVRNPRKQALLFVDLDNFKTLNDTLGHEAGDVILHEVARRLTGCVREADTVSRLGGDEFVVMLENLNAIAEDAADQARHAARKVLDAIDQPFVVTDRECHIPCSIGITVFGAQSETTHEILQQAEIAMHHAKTEGRHTIRFFSHALQAAVNARAFMEEDLRHAIKTHQFVLYYQPQVDSTGLIGVEALIRWNHPLRGFLAPDEFIPLAEETGMILPLGEWVLEAACRQIAEWARQDRTSRIKVSVNISARQFRQPDFTEQVLAILDRTGAKPHNLVFELTESMLVENIEEIIAKMTVLKYHGLGFSLDDFGTGYSSLSYLKRLPLDQLKIDRAFVHDILVDVTSGAIAQTIISLGRAIGFAVLAEGVETEEQRDFLTRLGCYAFQGFLFSRPLPVHEFEQAWAAV